MRGHNCCARSGESSRQPRRSALAPSASRSRRSERFWPSRDARSSAASADDDARLLDRYAARSVRSWTVRAVCRLLVEAASNAAVRGRPALRRCRLVSSGIGGSRSNVHAARAHELRCDLRPAGFPGRADGTEIVHLGRTASRRSDRILVVPVTGSRSQRPICRRGSLPSVGLQDATRLFRACRSRSHSDDPRSRRDGARSRAREAEVARRSRALVVQTGAAFHYDVGVGGRRRARSGCVEFGSDGGAFSSSNDARSARSSTVLALRLVAGRRVTSQSVAGRDRTRCAPPLAAAACDGIRRDVMRHRATSTTDRADELRRTSTAP